MVLIALHFYNLVIMGTVGFGFCALFPYLTNIAYVASVKGIIKIPFTPSGCGEFPMIALVLLLLFSIIYYICLVDDSC